MPSQHKRSPLTFRLPEAEEALLRERAAAEDRKVGAIVAESLRIAGMIAAMAEEDLTVRVTWSAAADGEPWCVAVEEAGGPHPSVDYGDSLGEAVAAAYGRREGVYALRPVG